MHALVEGVPITQYCDDRKSTILERLKLFMAVCHAVQHAHQKGLLHRDTKPAIERRLVQHQRES